MSDATPEKPLDPRVTTLRVILVVLLVAGAAGLVYALTQKPMLWKADESPVMWQTYALVGAAALLVVAFWIVPSLWTVTMLGKFVRGEVPPEKMADPASWLAVYVAQSVLGYVLLAAAVWMLAFAFMQEPEGGTFYIMLTGAAILIFMGVQYPTRDKVNRWLTSQWEWVKQQQQNKPQ